MNIKRKNISCIILAGGKGSRFNNQDKGLVKFKDKPLIEHVINIIQPQVDDIVISANRNIDSYNNYSSNVVQDNDENFCGPLSGIASAIPHCKHEWILIVPCDMPLLPTGLVTQMQENMNDQLACIAEANGRLQLVLFMHSSLLSSIQDSLSQKHYKLIKWAKSQNHIIVQFDDDAAFNNVNTPEQLAQL